MKQIAIFCSPDLDRKVIGALDEARVEGFMRVASGTGNFFKEPGQIPRTMSWEATLFIVPAASDEQVERVLAPLREHAGNCETAPCLRVTVTPVEGLLG
jgi:hypothetical protein